MRFFTTITVTLLLGNLILYAEPSVYGNTNGFTSSKKIMQQNSKMMRTLQHHITQQKEQIEGLQSIVEGLSATVAQLQQGGDNKNTQNNHMMDNNLLHEMGVILDKINKNYVTKEELKNVLNQKNELSKVISKPVTSSKNNTQFTIADSYTEGVRLFVKKRFNEAKKRFILTDSKGYKTASSNYYLGEIAYYTKQYEDAVFYYKKSAGMNDKASYIDTLLLHTAISLEYRGEKVQAKAFYENIIVNYDGRKTASIAREKLENL